MLKIHKFITSSSDSDHDDLFYEVDLRSRSERNIWRTPTTSNAPTVTEIGGDIDDENTSTDVSVVTMTPVSPAATNAATTSTNRSKTRVTISTTSISSQNISYRRDFILQSRKIKIAKR